jgi:hypothetical protein
MVVGPRFNPPGFEEGIGAVGRGVSGRFGVNRAKCRTCDRDERSGHDIAVEVDVKARRRVDRRSFPAAATRSRGRRSGRAARW